MPANFERAYNTVMKIEGGYSNNPADRGGETWKGIARKKNPSWRGWLLVDAARKLPGFPGTLKTNQALEVTVKEFYREFFWDKSRLGEFINHSIAVELFDSSVNMGPATAVMILQRALNVLNRNGKDYMDIEKDGFLGQTTLSLVNKHPNPLMLYNVMNTLQGAHYIKLAEADTTQEVFMYGWLTRVYEAPSL